jgi:uncharacterized repeat protein (TIGR01451 family)
LYPIEKGDDSMKRIPVLLLVIVVLLAGIGIASADDPLYFTVQKSHAPTPVNAGDEFTYTITITNPTEWTFFEYFVFDTLPDEVEFIECSGGSECNHEALPQIAWEGIVNPKIEPSETQTRTITVRLKPGNEGKTFCNSAFVGGGRGEIGAPSTSGSTTVTDCFTVGTPTTAPEFPTFILPVALLAGMLLAVLYIRKSQV